MLDKLLEVIREEYKAIENDMPEIEARDNLDSHIFIGWLEALDFVTNQINTLQK